MSTGKKDNFKNLRIFGCHVWVRPPGLTKKRFKDNARKGIFLGYVPHTDRLIVWYDVETHRVKIATHCKFDEGMNDLPSEQLPLGFQQLTRVNDDDRVPCDDKEISNSDLDFFVYPFADKEIAHIPVTSDDHHKHYGMSLADDELSGRVYVRKVADKSSVHRAIPKGYSIVSKVRTSLTLIILLCLMSLIVLRNFKSFTNNT